MEEEKKLDRTNWHLQKRGLRSHNQNHGCQQALLLVAIELETILTCRTQVQISPSERQGRAEKVATSVGLSYHHCVTSCNTHLQHLTTKVITTEATTSDRGGGDHCYKT